MAHRSRRFAAGVALPASLLAGCSILLMSASPARAQQQLVDPDFRPLVERPAYGTAGPTVAIDEAHGNFHTAGGQYAPFAALLRADGYHVSASTQPFSATSLRDVRVLVIANARNMPALLAGDITQPAFTDAECDAIRDWVRGGGSLLLVADHAPFGHAANALAQRFGITMGKGWAFDRNGSSGITTQLTFSAENGLLGAHRIVSGRDKTEAVRTVRSFTGQSLSVPAGATVLMKLSASAREAATPDDLNAEAAASADTFGSHSKTVAGLSQGLALVFGNGRVVVLGEAAMLSAQVLRVTEAGKSEDMRFGMNAPGSDDRQFALNVIHWLSRLLN